MTLLKAFSSLPGLNEREILRYAGVNGETDEFHDLIVSLYEGMKDGLIYHVCYTECEIKRDGGLDFGFAKTGSKSLEKCLEHCDKAVIFVATVGFTPDVMISKYRLQPRKALFCQSIGAERVEMVCDAFCDFICEKYKDGGYKTVPRFSPGYGDLDISFNTALLDTLEAGKNIGVKTTSGGHMTPTKSVSAIIGLKKIRD